MITKEMAIEAIEGVAELTREMTEAGPPDTTNQAAALLVRAIAESFAIKDYP